MYKNQWFFLLDIDFYFSVYYHLRRHKIEWSIWEEIKNISKQMFSFLYMKGNCNLPVYFEDNIIKYKWAVFGGRKPNIRSVSFWINL